MGASRDIHRQMTMKAPTAIIKLVAVVSQAAAVIIVVGAGITFRR
jgi:hypothetical protein